MKRLQIVWKAARQLGVRSVSLYARYGIAQRLGLTGIRPPGKKALAGLAPDWEAGFRPPVGEQQLNLLLGDKADSLLALADEIVAGIHRPFGGEPSRLDFSVPASGQPWERAQNSRLGEDIKFLWEPARLGWAFRLIEAYQLSGDARYEDAFWRWLEEFERNNLPYNGPNWSSGQEAALRILALAAAGGTFPLDRNKSQRLASLLVIHVARLPPTLLYARAQENNHLLSEAAGLFTAGLLLRNRYPEAADWLSQGWYWFNYGLLRHIEADGSYIQQSANYHRLMLQLALWMNALLPAAGESWPLETAQQLAAATRWLIDLLDPVSGRAPNLGHNDGSLILPLAQSDFDDYRPTAQAASRAFLGAPALPNGPWDAFSAWLRVLDPQKDQTAHPSVRTNPLRIGGDSCWATLRAVRFSHRPAHADQLNVELWWDGINVLGDPGTYRYNDDPPWDNGLASARVHNSITVDGREPMLRAGQFLWLDWDQALGVQANPSKGSAHAERSGYHQLGVRHQRLLERSGAREWRVTDRLLPDGQKEGKHRFVLHWFSPLDGSWVLEGNSLTLRWEQGGKQRLVRLEVEAGTQAATASIARAGQVVAGDPIEGAELLGWYSPTYAARAPACSYVVAYQAAMPLEIRTTITLEELSPPS